MEVFFFPRIRGCTGLYEIEWSHHPSHHVIHHITNPSLIIPLCLFLKIKKIIFSFKSGRERKKREIEKRREREKDRERELER
ncbi:hypothetical protein Scep_009186 [Stephania cephalantha]|uniref:Uncharacterized protein n=1 Tax=Stephania cephalantha TaxID=152367 RepID=A0AAP0JTM5_9MAGN